VEDALEAKYPKAKIKKVEEVSKEDKADPDLRTGMGGSLRRPLEHA
jgi:hypothetical protein